MHEHDPLEIISSIEACIEGAVKAFETQGHSINSIKAVGINKSTGNNNCLGPRDRRATYNAIVWTDTRTQALVRKLKSPPRSDKLQDLCGLRYRHIPR